MCYIIIIIIRITFKVFITIFITGEYLQNVKIRKGGRGEHPNLKTEKKQQVITRFMLCINLPQVCTYRIAKTGASGICIKMTKRDYVQYLSVKSYVVGIYM